MSSVQTLPSKREKKKATLYLWNTSESFHLASLANLSKADLILYSDHFVALLCTSSQHAIDKTVAARMQKREWLALNMIVS